MLFWLPYFSPESFGFFCIRLLICFIVISSQLLIEFSFIVLECPILSVLFYPLSISVNLPSFASTFWYISSSCIVSFFPFLSFLSCSYLFQRFSFVLSLSVVFVGFLSEFQVEIPILVLTFLSCFFRGSQFSRELISLQHKLVHLIRSCYSLIYMSVLDSLYLSLPWLFSIQCF